MTRPLRIEVPGGFHHVVSRGNARRAIYLGDFDHEAFLRQLKACVVRFKWKCISYCLMGNHYHLLIQTPEPNLASGMRELNGPYAQAFNKRHGRDGHVFKARYRAQLVQDDSYLFAVARYIALNPVRAGLVVAPEQWRWSSYAGLLAGDDPAPTNPRPLLELLHRDDRVARRLFAEMVRGSGALPSFDTRDPIVGDRTFIERHAPAEPPGAEVHRRAWEQARPSLEDMKAELPADEVIRRARLEFHYTVREIAEALGCSTETIRRRLRMWDVRT